MMVDLKSRRSIRKYTSEPVTDEQITTLLEAAMAAPSAVNRKPWEFMVVRDANLRKQLSKVHPWAGMAAAAPVVFVVCGRPNDSDHWVEDCSAATENLLLGQPVPGLIEQPGWARCGWLSTLEPSARSMCSAYSTCQRTGERCASFRSDIPRRPNRRARSTTRRGFTTTRSRYPKMETRTLASTSWRPEPWETGFLDYLSSKGTYSRSSAPT